MNPTEKIDAALDSVLRAGNLITVEFMHKYERGAIRDAMREAMRKIMADSYIQGSNDAHDAMKGK